MAPPPPSTRGPSGLQLAVSLAGGVPCDGVRLAEDELTGLFAEDQDGDRPTGGDERVVVLSVREDVVALGEPVADRVGERFAAVGLDAGGQASGMGCSFSAISGPPRCLLHSSFPLVVS